MITITVTQSASREAAMRWMADIRELPGCPPVGYGETEEYAITALFLRLIKWYPIYLEILSADKDGFEIKKD